MSFRNFTESAGTFWLVPRLFELRAAMSLAQLWTDQNKRTEARDLLSPIYDWFTEGLNTPDLKRAKLLLESLK